MPSKEKLTREEMETVLLTNAATTEWNIYTSDPVFMRRFDRLGYGRVPDKQGVCYLIPRWAISFRKPTKKKMSPEWVAAQRKKLAGLRRSPNSGSASNQSEKEASLAGDFSESPNSGEK